MDFPFIKEALTQLFSKPSTIAFPAAPSPAKPNYRGRIVFHPDKCINCNMCERVCAGQAISHTSEPCEEGEKITRQFYLGSCTFCSHCASFCTHGAIELSDDYHMIATKEEDLIVSGTFIRKAPRRRRRPLPSRQPRSPPRRRSRRRKSRPKPKKRRPLPTQRRNRLPKRRRSPPRSPGEPGRRKRRKRQLLPRTLRKR